MRINPAGSNIVLLLLLVLFLAGSVAAAPGQDPPGGNVSAPLHTGAPAQTKQGDLTVEGKTEAGQLCLGGECVSSWDEVASTLGLGITDINRGVSPRHPSNPSSRRIAKAEEDDLPARIDLATYAWEQNHTVSQDASLAIAWAGFFVNPDDDAAFSIDVRIYLDGQLVHTGGIVTIPPEDPEGNIHPAGGAMDGTSTIVDSVTPGTHTLRFEVEGGPGRPMLWGWHFSIQEVGLE